MSIKAVAFFGGPASSSQLEQLKNNFQKALIGFKKAGLLKILNAVGHVLRPNVNQDNYLGPRAQPVRGIRGLKLTKTN